MRTVCAIYEEGLNQLQIWQKFLRMSELYSRILPGMGKYSSERLWLKSWRK